MEIYAKLRMAYSEMLQCNIYFTFKIQNIIFKYYYLEKNMYLKCGFTHNTGNTVFFKWVKATSEIDLYFSESEQFLKETYINQTVYVANKYILHCSTWRTLRKIIWK